MSTIATSGLCGADLAHQLFPRRPRGRRPRCPASSSSRTVPSRRRTESSAITTGTAPPRGARPAADRAVHLEASVERNEPVGQPAPAPPPSGSAPPPAVVAHLHDAGARPSRAVISRAWRPARTARRWSALPRRRSRPRLDRCGNRPTGTPPSFAGTGLRRDEPAQRRLEPALDQHRGMDATGQLPQLGEPLARSSIASSSSSLAASDVARPAGARGAQGRGRG